MSIITVCVELSMWMNEQVSERVGELEWESEQTKQKNNLYYHIAL